RTSRTFPVSSTSRDSSTVPSIRMRRAIGGYSGLSKLTRTGGRTPGPGCTRSPSFTVGRGAGGGVVTGGAAVVVEGGAVATAAGAGAGLTGCADGGAAAGVVAAGWTSGCGAGSGSGSGSGCVGAG